MGTRETISNIQDFYGSSYNTENCKFKLDIYNELGDLQEREVIYNGIEIGDLLTNNPSWYGEIITVFREDDESLGLLVELYDTFQPFVEVSVLKDNEELYTYILSALDRTYINGIYGTNYNDETKAGKIIQYALTTDEEEAVRLIDGAYVGIKAYYLGTGITTKYYEASNISVEFNVIIPDQEGYLTGNGKYRHLTIPTSLFADWLTENERHIKKILQVNETLVGSILFSTMTYEYNPTIKTFKSEEEIE